MVGEPAHTLHVLAILFSAKAALCIEGLHVGAKTFMEPHIAPIGIRNEIAPPFMSQFMVVECVEPPVSATCHGAVVKISAISYNTLVFHTEVRGLGNAVFVASKWIWA